MKEDQDKNLEKAILDEAEKLFLEKGFALSTTTEIARRVGCNQALVHYYYRTKEQLFNSIFEAKVKQFSSVFFDIDKSDIPLKEKLRRKIGAHFDMLSANRRIPFLMAGEIGVNEERFLNLIKAISEGPSAIIQKTKIELEHEIARGVIRPITIDNVILNVLSLNAMTFISLPIYARLKEFDEAATEEYLKKRREENIDTIINSLYL